MSGAENQPVGNVPTAVPPALVGLPPSLANVLRHNPAPIAAGSLGRTLVLAPHPDDESLGCGGTLALLRRAGQAVHVVFVSDGTLSHPNSATYPAPRLRDLREAEALAALRELIIPETEATFMRLPDRNVPSPGQPGHEQAGAELAAVIRAFGPDTVLVPFERDPHPDHRATYQLLTTALTPVANPPRVLEYLIWLWELGRPDDLPREGERQVVSVDIAPVIEAKKRAINAHQSQVTRLIDDDQTAFHLSPELLRHFDTPYELFLLK